MGIKWANGCKVLRTVPGTWQALRESQSLLVSPNTNDYDWILQSRQEVTGEGGVKSIWQKSALRERTHVGSNIAVTQNQSLPLCSSGSSSVKWTVNTVRTRWAHGGSRSITLLQVPLGGARRLRNWPPSFHNQTPPALRETLSAWEAGSPWKLVCKTSPLRLLINTFIYTDGRSSAWPPSPESKITRLVNTKKQLLWGPGSS